jgi:hypothetical protein
LARRFLEAKALDVARDLVTAAKERPAEALKLLGKLDYHLARDAAHIGCVERWYGSLIPSALLLLRIVRDRNRLAF